MADVRFNNLTKIYPGSGKQPDFVAVKSINLEIRDHEFMVLVGPSGCGKSTTLRMLAGLEEITSGECRIGDRLVNDILPKDRDIAMVFQNYALYPHMSVFDNMAFGLKLQKKAKDEIKTRVSEAADILGLTEILGRKPKALSGGQRQRVAVGRAIVRKPKVFLFDEPLSNLDAKMRVQMRTEISKLHARLDATMVYVTHDQVEAMTMGDRICVLKDGEIMQVDKPLTLYNHPRNMFVAGFIGSPQMNFVKGCISKTGGSMRFVESGGGTNPVSIVLSSELADRVSDYVDKPIVLGIRPESIFERPPAASSLRFAELHAQIKISEPMGSETFLYLSTGATELVAKLHSDYTFNMGDWVNLKIDLNQVHFFDPQTEKVI